MFKFAAKKGEKEINYRGRVRKKKKRGRGRVVTFAEPLREQRLFLIQDSVSEQREKTGEYEFKGKACKEMKSGGCLLAEA